MAYEARAPGLTMPGAKTLHVRDGLRPVRKPVTLSEGFFDDVVRGIQRYVIDPARQTVQVLAPFAGVRLVDQPLYKPSVVAPPITAPQTTWLTPGVMIGGGVILLLLLLKKR